MTETLIASHVARPDRAGSSRPVFLDVKPHIADYYKKGTSDLFDETGGNTGNLAFMYAVTSHASVAGRVCHFGQSSASIRDAGDVAVLALANQLGSHTDLALAAERLSALDMPILGFGLGAQANALGDRVTLQPGTEHWLRVLASHGVRGPNIGVRGPFTQQVIASLGLPEASLVTGCPSNFLNLDVNVGAKVASGFAKPIRSIAVNAGIPYIPFLEKLEQNLADIVSLTDSAYIVQHGLQMVQLARDDFDQMEPASLELCRKYISPNRSLEQFKSWCKRYAFAFFDVRAWMDFVRRFDFVVGTRFHGAMLAIQAGVPAGCIAHDSRTLEMCQTMRIPVVDSRSIDGALTPHNILDYFRFDADDYVETRRTLAKAYCSIWQNAGIPILPGLTRIAGLA